MHGGRVTQNSYSLTLVHSDSVTDSRVTDSRD